MRRATRRSRGRPPHPGRITPGEARVLEQVRAGLSNDAIGRRLGLSVNGVKFHISNLLTKLACVDRRELADWRGEGGRVSESRPDPVAVAVERTVRFPADRAIGTAFIRDRGPDDRPEPYWRVRHAFGHWQELGPALGDVRVPPQCELGLRMTEGTSDDPWLLSLGPDDVQVRRALPDCSIVQDHESWLIAGAQRHFGHGAE